MTDTLVAGDDESGLTGLYAVHCVTSGRPASAWHGLMMVGLAGEFECALFFCTWYTLFGYFGNFSFG